ncbi:MAG: rhodanese-like domain-containing protein [Thermodesulfobacteriota bacterium]
MIQLRKLFTPVESLDAAEAQAFMNARPEGGYTLLDVRQPGEYEAEHLPGARLIPLPELPSSLERLAAGQPVMVYCAIGGRSRVAAQLLAGQGFKEVYNLKGGIKAWHGAKAAGPSELNLDLVRGDAGQGEILVLAYGMERSLQIFYLTLGEKAQDQQVAALFQKLAAVEERHLQLLLELEKPIDPAMDLPALAAQTSPGILEGGFEAQEFIRKNEPYLQTVTGVLEMAMMLETQALDLYLRLAGKLAREDAKQTLFKIAAEEKAHLAALGRLLEEKAG